MVVDDVEGSQFCEFLQELGKSLPPKKNRKNTAALKIVQKYTENTIIIIITGFDVFSVYFCPILLVGPLRKSSYS